MRSDRDDPDPLLVTAPDTVRKLLCKCESVENHLPLPVFTCSMPDMSRTCVRNEGECDNPSDAECKVCSEGGD